MDHYKRFILLSVCCVLSICHVIGVDELPAKGGQSNDIIDDLPHTYDEAKSRSTKSMRSKLAREKRGSWIDKDPGNRATKTVTTVIIPNTPPETFPSKTKTYVTTTSSIGSTMETSSNKKPCCATTPISSSTKVHGQFVPVIVLLLVWKLFTSTDYLEL